jgi:hypothetical protein
MPLNHNPAAKELLEWHGHDRGGVHVPFQAGSNPFGGTIPTPLVVRLRDLAAAIASGSAGHPRWIFLVGGPGNGKSETVHDFLTHLDNLLGLGGSLSAHLVQKYRDVPIVPRKVEVIASDLAGAPAAFAEKVGRLVIVQDATATEDAEGNAARELADDIVDLLTVDRSKLLPVFLVCANRGLLSRALREAFLHWGGAKDVTQLIVELIRASSLGADALEGRPQCWPLESEPHVACWPLDLESLLVGQSGQTPFDRIFDRATTEANWETDGRCKDCTAREICPLRQNAAWLRQDSLRNHLRSIIRRGELASGQRWNFRDLFSLAAELIVGQWSDFEGNDHPCAWVHKNAQMASVSVAGVGPAISLAEHLYPHALFRGVHTSPGETPCRELLTGMQQGISREVIRWACDDVKGSSKPIRAKLSKELERLDPAIFSPSTSLHPLRLVEDHFSQSIELGKSENWQPALTKAESLFLEILDAAERDWDLLSRDITRAVRVIQVLRRTAAVFVKRSIGVRLGHHAMEHYLKDYEASLRDTPKLRQATTALQPLLGDNGFRFNVVESFGQPQAEGSTETLVVLEAEKPGVVAHPAPTATPNSPGHDIPSFEITGTGYRMPLTFDFYLALRLRQEGCAGSSLPASVRAALDRVRHRFAGKQFRDLAKFVDGRARIVIDNGFVISVPGVSSPPIISAI